MSDDVKQIGSGLDDFTFEDPAAAGRKGSATADDVKEAMGNQIPRLPRIKVLHGGSAMFKNESTGKNEEKLRGVIVAFTPHNSFFGKKFDDRVPGERPKCYSNDGMTIAASAPEPQNIGGCASCPRNRDADRGSEARKTAFDRPKPEVCNNYKTLVMIVQGGGEIPFAIQLSNSAFMQWAAYAQEIYSRGRFQLHEVVTEISLVTVTRPGQNFSEPRFKMLGVIPEKALPVYAQQHEVYGEYLHRRSEIGAEGGEDNASSAADAVRRAKEAEEAAKGGGQAAL